MSAATATRPLRRRSPERTAMTPEQELELLIAEQQADDTRDRMRLPVNKPSREISFDAPVSVDDSDDETVGTALIGFDPWDGVAEAVDSRTDPAEVAYSGGVVTFFRPRRGDGLADPRKIPHGTAGGYQNHACKCNRCRGAWAEYQRNRRAAKRAESP